MNNPNLPDDKMNALLGLAAGKLGKSPEEIKAQMESGNVDSLTAGLDPKTQARINGLLQDPKQLEALLQNPALQKLLGGLGKK